MNTTNVLTRTEYRSRRAMMTQLVRRGAEKSDVARWFGAGLSTVYLACRENDLPGKCGPRDFSARTYSILARLLNSDASLAAIAREFRVSYQYVQQIRVKARAAGISVPERPGRGPVRT